MKFKAKRNSTFRGKMFETGKEYELDADEQRIIGKFFEGVEPAKAEEVKKAEPKKEEAKEPKAEEETPKEEPKPKAKRK